MGRPVIEFRGVGREYPGSPPVRAVSDISFALERGAFAALVGPSGSGKTTLLNLASGLDRPTHGHIVIADIEINLLEQSELCDFRRRHMGFVFQSYNLFPVLTAVENVEYTCVLRGDKPRLARERALHALEMVGLADKTRSYPNQLSGGQQQRVAVARSLATEPDIIFADEPTANLDSISALHLISLFEELNKKVSATFLFSTHDMRLVERVRTKLEMKDGRIINLAATDMVGNAPNKQMELLNVADF